MSSSLIYLLSLFSYFFCVPVLQHGFMTLMLDGSFIHRVPLYSGLSSICSHFVVLTLFEMSLNQGSHKFLAFDAWMGL